MKIIIGGDFCITPELLGQDLIDNSVINLFVESDMNIVNLECPVTADHLENKINKSGPHLRTDTAIFNYLKQLNVHSVTLANNHILDYGSKGIEDTFMQCTKNNIGFMGAGKNLVDAAEPHYFEKSGIKLAIINACEREWSIANESAAGANPIDLIDSIHHIRIARENADFVICIMHGGHEYYPLPSPRMVKHYRFLAENGADIIIGHHPHCISGYEYHNGIPIVYSLGNLLFTNQSKNASWFYGMLTKIELSKNSKLKLETIFTQMDQKTFKLSLVSNPEILSVLEQNLSNYNQIINSKELLNNKWMEYVQNNTERLRIFYPVNSITFRPLRGMLKLMGLNKYAGSRQYQNAIRNNIQCQSHHDLIKQIFTANSTL